MVLRSSRTTCATLGLPTALAPMRLRIMRVRAQWIFYVHAAKEDAEAARDWIESVGPRTFHVSANGVIRAEVTEIPAELQRVLEKQRFADLRVGADSSVGLDIHDAGGGARDAATPRDGRAVRRVVEVTLTDRQAAALSRAVRAGYYAVPRRTDLQWLADSMGIGTSSLSELLRRAEGRLADAYVANHPGAGAAPLPSPSWPFPPEPHETGLESGLAGAGTGERPVLPRPGPRPQA